MTVQIEETHVHAALCNWSNTLCHESLIKSPSLQHELSSASEKRGAGMKLIEKLTWEQNKKLLWEPYARVQSCYSSQY